MTRPRVVFDTNIIVAAFRSSRGASSTLLQDIERGSFKLLLSTAVMLEYEEVLRRQADDLRLTAGMIDDFVNLIRLFGTRVRVPARPVPPLSGVAIDDMHVAHLAVAGEVDHLVTHNLRDFAGFTAENFVLRPGELVKLLRESL